MGYSICIDEMKEIKLSGNTCIISIIIASVCLFFLFMLLNLFYLF